MEQGGCPETSADLFKVFRYRYCPGPISRKGALGMEFELLYYENIEKSPQTGRNSINNA